MEAFMLAAPDMLARLWWPFCRILAALSAAPILGEAVVPARVRVALSVLLSSIALPVSPSTDIDPVSLSGAVLAAQQILIGLLFGATLHLVLAAFMVLGYLFSSQMGLAMAVMNDPLNGSSSDVISGVLYILCILLFFAIDGHLVVTQILYTSFRVWPVGHPIDLMSLRPLAYQVGWLLSAAMLLAIPIIFSSLVIQIGNGFTSRAVPTINIFSLGFAVTIVFGMLMLVYLIGVMPSHYVKMSEHVLGLLEQHLGATGVR
jgi:flagellar biosynthetic protein FliR